MNTIDRFALVMMAEALDRKIACKTEPNPKLLDYSPPSLAYAVDAVFSMKASTLEETLRGSSSWVELAREYLDYNWPHPCNVKDRPSWVKYRE